MYPIYCPFPSDLTPMNIDEPPEQGPTPMDIDPPEPTRMDLDKTSKVEREEKMDDENTDGLICPICMESWTTGGEHQVCCLPCGHLFGLSCLNRWLNQLGSWRSKCPQCRSIGKASDIRLLYASRIVAVDEDDEKEELRKRIRFLQSKCAQLENNAGWGRSRIDIEWLRIPFDFNRQEAQRRSLFPDTYVVI